MTEWWTYRPEDFLLFSERVYWRLFEIHNEALWPSQPVAVAFGAVILFLVFRPRPSSGRLISALMAASWLFVGWAYHWNAYATINWAARWAAVLFAIEAVLFLWFGIVRDRLVFAMRRNPRSILRVLLFVYAVFLHPLIPLLTGKSVTTAEIFALTPDPTAIATLGLLGLSGGGGAVLLLLIVPAVWCLVSWGTLSTMGTWEAWIPLAAVVFAVLTRPWRRAPIGH